MLTLDNILQRHEIAIVKADRAIPPIEENMMTHITTHPHPRSHPHLPQNLLIGGLLLLVAVLVILAVVPTINLLPTAVVSPVNRSYDNIEQLRVIRAIAYSTNMFDYEDIEAVRISRNSLPVIKASNYDAIEAMRLERQVAAYYNFYDKIENIRLNR